MTFVKKALSPDEYGDVLFQHDWMRGETLSRLMSDLKRQGHITYRSHQVELCNLHYLKEPAADARRTF
ncbi:hypothetical protein [Pectobacterium sp. LFLA-215]|uniref:hypothetical protein n=1 Tax=Pectobacterium sp. LFLA-215 TaxID=3419008 RepID=UPI003F5C8933